MTTLTDDEVARGLRALNVPEHLIARRLGRPSDPSPSMSTTAHVVWPVQITIPWSALVSDNEKFRASMKAGKPIMCINRDYKQATERIAALARDRMAGAPPASTGLRLTATVWMPSASPRDITNFCKCTHDALEGVVYDNDRWLYDVRWIRAGVDVDAPRAVVVIRPLPHSVTPP